jgi:LAO/AO transport system kinase
LRIKLEELEITELVDGIIACDRKAVARAITLVESKKASDVSHSEKLLEGIQSADGSSLRIGISGSPGVGKSTFIESIGQLMLDDGNKLAVLAIDPSSSISGGSILGDKTRMESLSRNEKVFIRPSPSGESLGGVNRSTRESIAIIEAAGFNITIVETVGVGQSQTEVFDMIDIFIVLLSPGAGDQLQGIKRGIIEVADILVVNKSDGDLKSSSRNTVLDYKNALKLLKPRIKDWSVPVIACSSLENIGLDECWESIQNFQKFISASGLLQHNRNKQQKKWLLEETKQELLDALEKNEDVQDKLRNTQANIDEDKRPIKTKAKVIVESFLDKMGKKK